MIFIDEANEITCAIKIGGKPSDTISGEIIHKGIIVSKVRGSYLSYIEFDGERYWDIRENFPISLIELEKNLPSSSLYREDRKLLEINQVEEAQISKDKIENIQRSDRKLRENYPKK